MRFDDLIRISFRQLVKQLQRNFGILITIGLGTAGFIVVVTMGQNIENSIKGDLELIGRATRIKASFSGVEPPKLKKQEWFRDTTVQKLRRLPDVVSVSLIARKNGIKIFNQDHKYVTTLIGVDEDYFNVDWSQPSSGSFFTITEIRSREKVCILGESLALEIFNRIDIIGTYLQIENDLYRVVGVLNARRGSSTRSEWIFLPLTTAIDRINKLSPPNVLFIRCSGWDEVEGVATSADRIIKSLQPAEDLKIDIPRRPLRVLKRIAWSVKIFTNLAIAATLFLGGFGMWNSMMTALKARTREIGLKKAVGAQDSEIFAQFFTEALCFSMLSSWSGALLGWASVETIAFFLKIQPPETLIFQCVVVGVLFAMVLGISAGLIPAIRASRMEVIAAVRYE